jgi:hypothetical protein
MDFEFDSFVTTFSNPLSSFEVLAESMVTAGIGEAADVTVDVTVDIGVDVDVSVEVGNCCSDGILGEVGPGLHVEGE